MKLLVMIIFIVSINISANVTSGDVIESMEYNNSKFTVGDIKHSISDIRKILDLGWSPNISIKDGLEKCFGGII